MLKKITPFLILLFTACSLNKPLVSEFSVKRIAVETDNSLLLERLSVFIRYYDEDGTKDYESLTIVQNETGLTWRINRTSTAFFTDSENKKDTLKLGSNKFTYPLGKFPKGDYTIILKDLMGHQDVKTFTLSGDTDLSTQPLSFKLAGSNWEITAKQETLFNHYAIILLGADKQPVFVKRIGFSDELFLSGSIDELKKSSGDARYIQCLAENAEKTMGYLTKVLEFN